MENLYPFSPKNQGWENGTFWLLGGSIFDLGEWVLLFHFILSMIVAIEQTLCLAEGG